MLSINAAIVLAMLISPAHAEEQNAAVQTDAAPIENPPLPRPKPSLFDATGDNPAALVSAFRHQHGEVSVVISAALTRIAQKQANALAMRDPLDHNALAPFSSRIGRSGLSRAAENIGYGHADLSSLVEDETAQRLTLKRQVAIEILAANAKWVRGLTAIGITLDESAYLPSNEDAANSDISILEALKPSVATTGAPVLLVSSPATTTGIVHSIWKKNYGAGGSPDCVVAQCDSKTMNPRLRQSVLDKAFADDATAASREYAAQFAEPFSSYISREILERLIERGMRERVPLPGIEYRCFVDASSGSGTDSFAAAIGHAAIDDDRHMIILDQVLLTRPPFDPLAVVAALAGHLERWRIREIMGDNFTGGFLVSAFAKHGVTYLQSPLNASELFIAALPTFTSGSIALLDNADLLDQLVNMRRKIGSAGKEQVLHMRSHHDDLANAVVGLIHMLTPRGQLAWDFGGFGVVSQPRTYVGDGGEASETWRRGMRRMAMAVHPMAGLAEARRIVRVRLFGDAMRSKRTMVKQTHTGDVSARKKLDALYRESAEHASELHSIDEALKAAAERAAREQKEREAKAITDRGGGSGPPPAKFLVCSAAVSRDRKGALSTAAVASQLRHGLIPQRPA